MLAYIKEHRPRGGVSDRVSYITRLYNEEFHLVARDKFRSVADLSGKRVNFGPEDSGSYLTATTVFKALGVEVVPQTFDTETALEKLKNGEIDAMAVVAGKPAPALQSIPPKSGLKLLTIDFAGPLTETYLPSSFTAKDYPGLVGRGKVETIAVGSVMAVFNWKTGTEPLRTNPPVRRCLFRFLRRLRPTAAPGQVAGSQSRCRYSGLETLSPGPGLARPQSAKSRAIAAGHREAAVRLQGFSRGIGRCPDAQRRRSGELFKRFLEWRAAGAQ